MERVLSSLKGVYATNEASTWTTAANTLNNGIGIFYAISLEILSVGSITYLIYILLSTQLNKKLNWVS